MTIRFQVLGTPIPQGSKVRTKWGMREDNPKTRPWRDQIAWEARAAMGGEPPLIGPVQLEVAFTMPRPKSHYRANGDIKPSAPAWCPKRPDVDKLLRALCDGMTAAGVWRDDSQVVYVDARKHYESEWQRPGCYVIANALQAVERKQAA